MLIMMNIFKQQYFNNFYSKLDPSKKKNVYD